MWTRTRAHRRERTGYVGSRGLDRQAARQREGQTAAERSPGPRAAARRGPPAPPPRQHCIRHQQPNRRDRAPQRGPAPGRCVCPAHRTAQCGEAPQSAAGVRRRRASAGRDQGQGGCDLAAHRGTDRDQEAQRLRHRRRSAGRPAPAGPGHRRRARLLHPLRRTAYHPQGQTEPDPTSRPGRSERDRLSHSREWSDGAAARVGWVSVSVGVCVWAWRGPGGRGWR
jgi:hypothetical protein